MNSLLSLSSFFFAICFRIESSFLITASRGRDGGASGSVLDGNKKVEQENKEEEEEEEEDGETGECERERDAIWEGRGVSRQGAVSGRDTLSERCGDGERTDVEEWEEVEMLKGGSFGEGF